MGRVNGIVVENRIVPLTIPLTEVMPVKFHLGLFLLMLFIRQHIPPHQWSHRHALHHPICFPRPHRPHLPFRLLPACCVQARGKLMGCVSERLLPHVLVAG